MIDRHIKNSHIESEREREREGESEIKMKRSERKSSHTIPQAQKQRDI